MVYRVYSLRESWWIWMNLECFKLVFPWSFLFPTLGKWDDQFGIKWPPQSWLMGWFTIGFTTLDLKKIEGWCGTAVEACVAVSAIDIYTSRKWDEYIYIYLRFSPSSKWFSQMQSICHEYYRIFLEWIIHHLPKIHRSQPLGLADPENWLLLFV